MDRMVSKLACLSPLAFSNCTVAMRRGSIRPLYGMGSSELAFLADRLLGGRVRRGVVLRGRYVAGFLWCGRLIRWCCRCGLAALVGGFLQFFFAPDFFGRGF